MAAAPACGDSVFVVNDDESGLHADYEEELAEPATHEPVSQCAHDRTREDSAHAHLKRQIMGGEVLAAVTNGRLDFGTWERISYGEFDGRRRKRVVVKIAEECMADTQIPAAWLGSCIAQVFAHPSQGITRRADAQPRTVSHSGIIDEMATIESHNTVRLALHGRHDNRHVRWMGDHVRVCLYLLW